MEFSIVIYPVDSSIHHLDILEVQLVAFQEWVFYPTCTYALRKLCFLVVSFVASLNIIKSFYSFFITILMFTL